MSPWLWFLIPVLLWGGVRIGLVGSKGAFESPAAARNRGMARSRDPWRVQVISVVLFLGVLWWIFYGSAK